MLFYVLVYVHVCVDMRRHVVMQFEPPKLKQLQTCMQVIGQHNRPFQHLEVQVAASACTGQHLFSQTRL
jgi:hypothetical protein